MIRTERRDISNQRQYPKIQDLLEYIIQLFIKNLKVNVKQSAFQTEEGHEMQIFCTKAPVTILSYHGGLATNTNFCTKAPVTKLSYHGGLVTYTNFCTKAPVTKSSYHGGLAIQND